MCVTKFIKVHFYRFSTYDVIKKFRTHKLNDSSHRCDCLHFSHIYLKMSVSKSTTSERTTGQFFSRISNKPSDYDFLLLLAVFIVLHSQYTCITHPEAVQLIEFHHLFVSTTAATLNGAAIHRFPNEMPILSLPHSFTTASNQQTINSSK